MSRIVAAFHRNRGSGFQVRATRPAFAELRGLGRSSLLAASILFLGVEAIKARQGHGGPRATFRFPAAGQGPFLGCSSSPSRPKGRSNPL